MTEGYAGRRFLAQCLLQAGRPAEAARAVMDALAHARGRADISPDMLLQDVSVALHLAEETGLDDADLEALRSTLDAVPADRAPETGDGLRYRLATLLQRRDRHWDAIALLRRVQGLSAPADRAAAHHALAVSFREVGELGAALEQVAQCQRICDAHPVGAQVAGHLATLEADLAYRGGDRERGDAAIARALDVPDADPTPILNVLLEYYGPRGNARALGEMLERLSASGGPTGPPDPARRALLNNLAVAAMNAGDLDAAESRLREALGAPGDGRPDRPDATLAMNRAKLCMLRGETEPAMAWMRAALDAEIHTIGSMLGVASTRERLGYMARMRESLEACLSLVAGRPQEDREARSVLGAVLERKGIDVEALAAQRRLARSPVGDAARSIRDRLAAIRHEQTRAGWAGLSGDGPAPAPDALGARAEQLEAELADLWTRASGSAHPLAVDPAAVIAALGPGEALLEFVLYRRYDFSRTVNAWGPRRYAVVTVRGGTGAIRVVDLGEAEPADRAVEALLSAAYLGAADCPDARRRLFELLIAPLAPALDGVDTLKIAPDGQLGLFPFDLLDAGQGRQLLDAYRIDYLTSGRDLVRPRGEPATPGPGADLVVAGPDFDLHATGATRGEARAEPNRAWAMERLRGLASFRALGGALAEGHIVSRLLGCPLWAGPEALDGRIKALSAPRLLHVASHGFSLAGQRGSRAADPAAREAPTPRLPFESGIVLAGANAFLRGERMPEGAEDGFLFSEEIAEMDLAGTQLVTLSACESGVGTALPGEGVTGLRRAFLAAGARTVIATLWPVPDWFAVELMEAVYGELLAGRTCGEAVRAARRRLRDAPGSDAFGWAGFICVGDPDTRLAGGTTPG